ncbi:hypothetical protein OEZ86_012767 [Tetradesmus obliquus]|nr:hypothetical protein OEZ86_012767 [Tetradesmus obliquus]
MLDATCTPQILEHLQKSLTHTVYDTKWIPGTANFVAVGQHARGTGCLQVYQLEGTDAVVARSIEGQAGFKCSHFGAGRVSEPRLAVGTFDGKLQLWDLEQPKEPLLDVQAHASIVNAIDAFGGQSYGYGPPELVTCGRDGCVRVWDVRQHDAPVAAFEPANSNNVRDCWCVAIGNSYDDQERCVLAGYDNGDVKMFDLRMNKLRWEMNVKNGVCGVQFDRRDIPMNKFVVTCLESQFHVFDARTQHPQKGFASVSQSISTGSTLWGAHHMPQNRDAVMLAAGDGSLSLWKYQYPDQRKVKDQDGKELGVAGSVQQLAQRSLSSQPVNSFDWSPDKQGLFVCSALDQCLRVGFVTKLHKL